MRETITQASNQITEKWTELPRKRKIQLSVGVLAIIIALGITIFMLTRPEKAILYSKLDMEAVSQITEVLDAEKITYELLDNGQTIQLNETDINRAKIALTRENVPKGNYTFDDAITNSLSTTEAEKRTKLIYLAQVDLENILSGMTDIRSATVQLNIPEEKNSFLASKVASSASVVLNLQNELSKSQINGIANLIANSVENLSTENITILDANSNVLFNGSTSQSGFGADDQQSLKLLVEENTKNKIITLLSPIYDEITISPNLVLNFDQNQHTTKTYTSPVQDSATGLISQEHTTAADGTNITGGGATPGLDANQDVQGYVAGDVGTGEYSTGTEDIYYLHNEMISNHVTNVGEIDYARSSLAVNVVSYRIYDQTLIEDTLPDGMSWEQYKADIETNIPILIEDTTIEAIQKGTGIADIVVLGYEKPVFIDEEPFEIDFMSFIPYILLLALGIIIVIAVIRFRKPAEVVETEPELQVEEMLQIVKEEVEEDELDELQDIEVREALETKKRIEKFIDEKPDAVARLLRNWLDEEWGE
ncbi:MAG: flagellar M-ring protein FliF [Epulopiscium sp. Nuni2H_MBin003]|nr:MAG: flagellar M-ring protein FliF [Epulopiscium sp. Nuni2H_MBin003]